MRIPVGISNRHIHLSQIDADKIFGKGYEFQKLKDVSQPGQYASKEMVIIKGNLGELKNIRIVLPLRKQTQVEIFEGDNYILGCNAPIRVSGDLKGSESLTVIGPKGSVYLQEGVIVAKRHLHITQAEADELGLKNNQEIKIKINNADRGLIFDDVVVRITDTSALDFHIDMEEADAAGLKVGDWGEIVN